MPAAPSLPLADLLRELAHAGASDGLLGQAVRELVVGKAPPPPQNPPPSAQVADPGMVPAAAPPAAARRQMPAQSQLAILPIAAEPVVVNFRKNGKRSSVYFTPLKWAELVQQVGTEAAAIDLVKQYAAVSPDTGNRSAWVLNAVRASGGNPPLVD